jgi:hypothetical protein
MRQTHGETWIDGQHGVARFPDGRLRAVWVGRADTFFSRLAKPSHGRRGFVMVDDSGELVFVPNK